MAVLKQPFDRAWHRYLMAIAATIAALAVATVVVTVVVDPYRMYGSHPVVGLTELKPSAYRHSDFVKEYLIERTKPRTLLLGNSRVEIGLDPQSPLWPQEAQPVFNAAESGHDLATAVVRLRQSMEAAPPRFVVLAVDFRISTRTRRHGGRWSPRNRRGSAAVWPGRSPEPPAPATALERPCCHHADDQCSRRQCHDPPRTKCGRGRHDDGGGVQPASRIRCFRAARRISFSLYTKYNSMSRSTVPTRCRILPTRCGTRISGISTRSRGSLWRRALASSSSSTPYHSTLLELWHSDGSGRASKPGSEPS